MRSLTKLETLLCGHQKKLANTQQRGVALCGQGPNATWETEQRSARLGFSAWGFGLLVQVPGLQVLRFFWEQFTVHTLYVAVLHATNTTFTTLAPNCSASAV